MKFLVNKIPSAGMALVLLAVFTSCTESLDGPTDSTPESSDFPKSSYENPMEWMGYDHNDYLAEYDKTCNAVDPHDIGYLCFGMDSTDVSEYSLAMVDSLGQPYVNANGTLSINVPRTIQSYLEERPVLSNFQKELLLVISDENSTVMQKYNAIITLEKNAESKLTGSDLQTMYAVGAVARHSLLYWSQRKLSPFSRYMARDFTAMWTVGAVSIFFPGVGIGAAVAAGAVASVTTDI